jgi:hypothetical protein
MLQAQLNPAPKVRKIRFKCSATPALAPMSRAELEHVLARGLEGKKIRLENNKLRLLAALHRAIHNFISQNGLASYLRQCMIRRWSVLET